MQYFQGLVTTLRSYMLSSIPVLGLGIGLLFLGNACDDTSTPQQICLQADPYDCPYATYGNARLDLRRGVGDVRYAGFDPNVGSFRDETTSFPGGVPYDKVTTDIQVTGSATMSSGQRRVEGMEINFGLWSKDSRYSWTYEEMFAWKHGRGRSSRNHRRTSYTVVPRKTCKLEWSCIKCHDKKRT